MAHAWHVFDAESPYWPFGHVKRHCPPDEDKYKLTPWVWDKPHESQFDEDTEHVKQLEEQTRQVNEEVTSYSFEGQAVTHYVLPYER